MKFFGWGKSKDPQLQSVLQQASKPGASSAGSHGALDRSKSHSAMRSVMPGKGGSTAGMRKQRGLFDVDEGGYLAESATSMPRASTAAAAVEEDAADSEEKLQDTIRFVFSHKREGLLAIGTFALEQLQSMRNTIDGSQNSDAAPDVMQSSDDEDQLQRRWIAARKTCDLPVFGDTELSGGEEEDDSKALTVFQPEPSSLPVKPIVLLSPLPLEIRRALDPLYGKKSFLPHWTDAVPPPQVLAKAPAPFVDEDYYSSRLCGLFSRKKSLKPHRRQGNEIVPADGDYKKRIIPIELAAQEAKKSMLKFAAPGVPTIGKLAKLWRASCKQSTARIAPERKPSPVKDLTPKDYAISGGVGNEPSGEVVTTPVAQVTRPWGGCSSPEVGEFRRRVHMADAPVELRGSGRSDYGHWIKDDEDFVVLEM